MGIALDPWARASRGAFNGNGLLDPWARASLGVWSVPMVVVVLEGPFDHLVQIDQVVGEVVARRIEGRAELVFPWATVKVEALRAQVEVDGALSEVVAISVLQVIAVESYTNQITGLMKGVVVIEDEGSEMSTFSCSSQPRWGTKVGDTLKMVATLTQKQSLDGGESQALDLTGATVELHYRPRGDEQAVDTVVDTVDVVGDATEGKVEVTWPVGGFARAGLFEAVFAIALASGETMTFPSSGAVLICVAEKYKRASIA